MSLYIIISIVLIVTFLSYIFVAGIRKWSEHRQILDIPNERSSHNRPIPRGGGISIVTLSISGLWIIYLIGSSIFRLDWLIYFSLGGLLVSGISLLDDLYSVRNTLRFTIHGVAGILIIWGVGYVSLISFPEEINFNIGSMGLVLTFIYIVGLTNAYNFMDGIDGIAAVQAIIAGVGWVIIGHIYSDPLILLLGLLIVTTSTGFLIHNWHPAKIFMGDVGSAFLGFTFATITMIAVKHDPLLLYAGILLVWPFIFDTLYTLFRRMVHKENIFEAHRSHLYQRLVISGWGHRSVTILYGILACSAFIPVGFIVWKNQIWYILTFSIPFLLFIVLIVVTSRYEKRYA